MLLHRNGDPGACRGDRAGARMDHRHAVVRRRLGRVRAGEHASLSEQHPVRRPWRAARSANRGRDRALRVVSGADRHAGGRAGAGASAGFLRREQEADGSWFGRWGTNYIYGTWSVLCALNAAGVAADDPAVRRAVAWLLEVQREDGGWGEDEESYRDAPHGRYKESTASQTAWALLGLMAAGERRPSCGGARGRVSGGDAGATMADGANCRTLRWVFRACSICATTATAGIFR